MTGFQWSTLCRRITSCSLSTLEMSADYCFYLTNKIMCIPDFSNCETVIVYTFLIILYLLPGFLCYVAHSYPHLHAGRVTTLYFNAICCCLYKQFVLPYRREQTALSVGIFCYSTWLWGECDYYSNLRNTSKINANYQCVCFVLIIPSFICPFDLDSTICVERFAFIYFAL